LQKAFDCVNHNILLTKLEFYGLTGIENKLFKSYLTNRFQRVIIRDNKHIKSTSTWKIMEHGVPQGSVLGPLLFFIYVNDLARIIGDSAKPVLFADDTSIIIANANGEEFKIGLEFTITETMKWFQCNLLSMNYKKNSLSPIFNKTV
jgi:hypothetical protein